MRAAAFFLVCAFFGSPLAGQATPPLGERFDFTRHRERFDLPRSLEEISGLATLPDGRVFGHGDEEAVLHEIDPWTGRIVKRFTLGDPPVRGDFEGIAVVEDRLFLVTSRGFLYETRDAPAGEQAPFRVTDTGLGRVCEVEGLAYDPAAGALLLACKTVPANVDAVVIHVLPLDPSRPRPEPIVVPWSALEPFGHPPVLHPSGLEVDPVSGHLVVVASREGLILELGRDRSLRSVVQLRRRDHRQPEGVSFRSDGALLIADEASGRRARLTVYGPPQG